MAFKALDHISYREYLVTDHWQQVWAAALWHADNRCQLCGSNTGLQVHHNPEGYEHLFEERPEHVICICRQCHKLFSEAQI